MHDKINLYLLSIAFVLAGWGRVHRKVWKLVSLAPVVAAVACGVAPPEIVVGLSNQPALVEPGSEGVVGSQSPLPSTVEAQPSPTPTIIEIISLDETQPTPREKNVIQTIFDRLIRDGIISGDNNYRGVELRGWLWIEDADPENNPSLSIGYGRSPEDVVKIFIDYSLIDGYYIGRTSDLNNDLEAHGLSASAVNFNINADGRLQGVDAGGNVLATRYTFLKSDGTQAAIFIPEGATIVPEGYKWNGTFYRFGTQSGGFVAEVYN